jgi:hypothetical protein
MRTWLLSVLVFLLSCGGSSPTTYVGMVDGTDVAVGLVTDGSNAALFFCGGPSSFATSTKWFRLPTSASSFTATKDNWSAQVTTTANAANGTVDRGDGQTLTWSAVHVPGDSVEGLYGSSTSAGTSGVVVRGVATTQGAFISAQLTVEQIIPIFPLDVQSAGLHVQIAGSDAFVPRATLP